MTGFVIFQLETSPDSCQVHFPLLFQMLSKPTKGGLLSLVKRKKLTGIIEELTNDDEFIEDWKSRIEEDWKDDGWY